MRSRRFLSSCIVAVGVMLLPAATQAQRVRIGPCGFNGPSCARAFDRYDDYDRVERQRERAFERAERARDRAALRAEASQRERIRSREIAMRALELRGLRGSDRVRMRDGRDRVRSHMRDRGRVFFRW